MQENSSEIPEGFNYPPFNEKGKVICQVCGKAFMILTPSHLKTHNLKYSEYSQQFPDAPITNEEFKALSKYSKPKYSEEDHKILGEETVIEDDIPVIDDEFEMPKNQLAKEFDNPMDAKKFEIFSFLADYLPNLKQDFLIEIFDIQQNLIFSTISDYSDPILKVNVEFPETFWHNRDAVYHDKNRRLKLEEHGWRVIELKGPAPPIKDIEKAIRKHLNL
ncbi:MAG: hypothetical protein R3250_17425 [Melioribacteraceae bacterium]|nr:hypothetical protein [Melioribacteraceae bacterium]